MSEISSVALIWEKSISVSQLCARIDEGDIVILDVGLTDAFSGFDLFFELLEQHYDPVHKKLRVSVIFDSGADCRTKLRDKLTEEQKPVIDQLERDCQIVFAKEEFNGNIVDSIKKVLGFSFRDACRHLFDPFLSLHVAVEHLQIHPEPNPHLFAPGGEFNDDLFVSLRRDLMQAHNYLRNMLTPYAQRSGHDSTLQPIGAFLNGSLRTLCRYLNRETDPQRRFAEIQRLVGEGGQCATFLDEFQKAVEALKKMDK